MSTQKKLILVLGATGAQGMAVVDFLLSPSEDETPSPYAIRALTPNPSSDRAKKLADKGVEIFKGALDDFSSAYGGWLNTDPFTIGEQKEIFIGTRIFEIAKHTPSMRQFVYSSSDYSTKVILSANAHQTKDSDHFAYVYRRAVYKADHLDGKAIVAEYLKGQPSVVSDNDMSWSCASIGPYMETMALALFAPTWARIPSYFVFASPVGDGHIPMIALADVGFWARYSFDHRAETSSKNLEVAREMVTPDMIAETFTKVTGLPAVHKRQTLDEWWENFSGVDGPVASEQKMGDGSTTIRQSFSGSMSLYRDDIITRDMDWIKSIHPNSYTLGRWMRETNYNGQMDKNVLKNEDVGGGAWMLRNKVTT